MHPNCQTMPRTYRQVDLGALARNIQALKALAHKDCTLMSVVKADAYGHGAVTVARTALEAGAGFLAVARFSEAAELRAAGIDAPILLFGEPDLADLADMAEHDIRASLTSLESAQAISRKAQAENFTLKVHIKLDTGMGRLGFVHSTLVTPNEKADQTLTDILAISSLPHLEIEGLYTHLAKADETDKTHAKAQMDRLAALAQGLKEKGFSPAYVHAANSAGIIDLPDDRFNMIRPGIAQYGLWPSQEVDKTRIQLEPVMQICSKIMQIKSVPAGFGVSYGITHVTDRPTTVATIPIGYADGYSRLLSNTGYMLVRGQKAPIIGRVCMDLTMIDVGHIPDAQAGDPVIVMGRQGEAQVTADDIARLTQTINYEVTAGLTARMPFCYIQDNPNQGPE